MSPLLFPNRKREMNCEDSRCSGVNQYELPLHLTTAGNGTAEPSFFYVQAVLLGWLLTL